MEHVARRQMREKVVVQWEWALTEDSHLRTGEKKRCGILIGKKDQNSIGILKQPQLNAGRSENSCLTSGKFV